MTTATSIRVERNRTFAAAGGDAGAVVFPEPAPVRVTCLDPRVDPRTFSAWTGDAMV